MNNERLELLLNKMYYNYLEKEEAKIIIDYIISLEEKRNKAIGHINACGCKLSKDETRYLLEILKGDSNE